MSGRGLVGVLLLLLASLTGAAANPDGPGLAAMPITDSGRQSLTGFIALYGDADGTRTIEDVSRREFADRFQPLSTAAQSLGYQRGANWLRFALVNTLDTATERWLEVGFVFTQHCTLYAIGADGRIERAESGASVGVGQRPVKAQSILLPVRLLPGERKDFFLQLRSKSAQFADLRLWDPGTYADATRSITALKYLGLGSSCVVVMLSIVAARVQRDWRLLGAGIAHLLMAFEFAVQDGLLFALVAPTDRPWQAQLAWCLALASFGFQILFARIFLGLPRLSRGLDRLTCGCILACAVVAPVPWLVFVPKLFALTIIAVILCMTAVTLLTAIRGEATARWYVGVWGAFWMAALIYLTQLPGWTRDLPFYRNNVVLAGFCLSGFMLCAALYFFIERIRAEADAARSQLLAHMSSEKQRLDAAIAEQTRELLEAKRRAEQASSSKSAFLSASSHELRTPLHTIIGYTDLLLREASGEARAHLQTVANSSRQLLRVIDDVLQFSRAQALVPQVRNDEVELRGLLAHVERSGSLLSRRGSNRFVLSASPQLPAVVRTDEQRLLQVLGNLIENAAKYTDKGSIRLDVTVDVDRMDDAVEGGRIPIRFAVSDDGPGIPVDEQSDIFQPFRRGSTGRTRRGAGLGLAIAQDLVAAMGGRIALDSVPGAGSTFAFTLDFATVPSPAPAMDTHDDIVGHEPPQRTLLLVEDHAENLHYLDSLCRSMGFRTLLASDVEAALRICRDRPPRPDAMLVDQRMPGADGWAFLREVRSHGDGGSAPIILMSAAPAEPPADLPMDLHFDATLLKPVGIAALAKTLQQLLHLRWRYARRPAAPPAARPAAPPVAVLGEARRLLEEGSITGLQRWAGQLARAEPHYREFGDAVIAACRAADLHAVGVLIGSGMASPDRAVG